MGAPMRKFLTGARLFDGERMIDGHALLVEKDLIVGVAPLGRASRGVRAS